MLLDSKTEEKVMRAINGDISAFGDLYELYALDMYKYALSMCKNPQDAEDAVQETALSVFRSIKNLQDPRKFKSYLFYSLANNCKRTLAGEKGLELNEEISYTEDYTDESVYVWDALSRLDVQSREIVCLSVFSGFKSHEIAKMLQIPAATVRTRLKRSLEKLGKELRV